MTENIILGILGSGNVILFIKFLIERADKKKEKQEESKLSSIINRLITLEKDVLRTQLLVLILMRPEEKQEILTIAERYFKKLQGDWYMTSIFNKWLTVSDVAEPEWFDSDK